MLTLQIAILLATVAYDAIPESKEQGYGKLVIYTTHGEEFKSPHIQTYVFRKLEDKGGIYTTLLNFLIDHFILWNQKKALTLHKLFGHQGRGSDRTDNVVIVFLELGV